jgi:hypothetical protein
MLDNLKKTEPLLVALKAAVPFEVELMPALIRAGPGNLHRALSGVSA